MGHQLDPVAEQKRLPFLAQSLINIEKLIAFHRLRFLLFPSCRTQRFLSERAKIPVIL